MSEKEIISIADNADMIIKINYLTMYEKWSEYSKEGYYQG
jgi:hypothetical protein